MKKRLFILALALTCVYAQVIAANGSSSQIKSASLFDDDVGVAAIDSIHGQCAGSHTVYVTVFNFGTNLITSVDVNWSVDGILQPPVHSTMPMLPGGLSHVFLGNLTLIAGSNYDIIAWTSSPNGMTDANMMNDTTHRNIPTAMGGMYTIGPSGDFQTFASAFAALESAGLCQDVQVNVEPGIYNEQVQLNEVAGTNNYRITFSSVGNDSTSVTLTSPSSVTSTDNFTLRLNDVDNVTFHAMTLERSGTSAFSTIVELERGSSGITFTSNRFLGTTGMSSSTIFGNNSSIFYSSLTAWNGLTVTGNYFQDNANGLWVLGNQATHAQNVVIKDNVFNTFYMGVNLSLVNGAEISQNTFMRNNTTSTFDYYGISVRFSSGALLIARNTINTSAGSYGIRLGECIQPIGVGASIQNNFVYVSASDTGRGISIEDGCNNVRILHNSVNYHGTSATNGRSLFIDGTGTANITVLNNIFSNSGGGYATYLTSSGASGVTLSDNNCYYTTGSTLAFWNADQANLSALQLATAMEANSVSGDPMFLSATDLHTTAGFLSNAGSSLALVSDDFDGDIRDTLNPDIGADEFTSVSVDEVSAGDFRIYPNPSGSIFYISGSRSFTGDIRIFDMGGRIVMHESVSNAFHIPLNVSTLESGIYYIVMDDGEQLVTHALSVLR